MKRLVLRNGFTLRAHEGVGHLTDVRTGDALLVPASHLVLLESAIRTGVDVASPAVSTLLARYGAFLVDAPQAPAERSFYELDLDDAPTIPPVRPEELRRPESSHRVLAVVAPPAEPSADWQLHGDAAKRVETPLPAAPDADADPWKVREPAASATTPAHDVPAVPPVSDAPLREPRPSLDVPAVPPVSDATLREPRPSPSRSLEVSTAPPRTEATQHEPRSSPTLTDETLRDPLRRALDVPSVPPVSDATLREPRPSPSRPQSTEVPAVPPLTDATLRERASPTRPGDATLREPRPSPSRAQATEVPLTDATLPQRARDVPAAPPVRGSSVPTQVDVPVAELSAAEELSRALAASDRQLNETAREPTTDAAHLQDVLSRGGLEPTVPTAEAELRRALETAQEPPPPEQPSSLLSQEENLRSALEQAAPPATREDVAALLESTAQQLGVTDPVPPSAPAAAPPPASTSTRIVGLALGGVVLLAASVGVSLWLRTGAEPTELAVDAGAQVSAPEAVRDAGSAALAVAPDAVGEAADAGAPVAVSARDAGVPAVASSARDAGAPIAVSAHDAGAPAVASSARDAGAPVAVSAHDAGTPASADEWLEATVQARGRVKMAEALARADGVVTWAVSPEQRVKTKQVLGKLTRADGTSQDMVADSVGLAMLSLESGATVRSGAVLAEIIYFEAWAKAVVRGATPTPAWRCEVVSSSLGQRADCKISVVTPRAGGAQVTVAIEPRWFDGAADAVLRLAP